MKILVTAEQLQRPVPGGVGTYVANLAKALVQTDDVDVSMLFSAGKHPHVSAPSVGSRLPVRAQTVARDIGLPLAAGWVARRCHVPGLDVVHSTSASVPKVLGAPLTAMVHDLAWRDYPETFPPRGRRWHEAALKRAIKRSKFLFTPSTLTADRLIADGVASVRVVVAPLGSDHVAAPDQAGADKLLAGLRLRGDFVLSVGTMEPRKNLPAVIEAFGLARRRTHRDMTLLVVGPEGWGESAPLARSHVMFAGKVSDAVLSALYGRCLTMVYAPLLEGFGLPVVEAMRAGAPVVCSPVPSAGDAAEIVDPSDVASIERGIAAVVGSADRRMELTEIGSAHARTLTWKSCAAIHVATWEKLL